MGCDSYYLLIVRPLHIYENTEGVIRRQVPGYREETRKEITTIMCYVFGQLLLQLLYKPNNTVLCGLNYRPIFY